eukprot:984070-Rhodomonas_salina.1
MSREDLLIETEALLRERTHQIDSKTQLKRNENFKVLAVRLQGSFTQGSAKTMQRVTGKMTWSNGMWGVDTDYPDTISISQLNADSAEIRALVSEGVAKRLVHDKGVDLTVNHLSYMHQLLSVCFLSFPASDSISLQKARCRVVTAACDKLCAQERFLGDNAMSKQAHCSTCEASGLQSISKVEADGTTTWGA